MTVEQLIKHLEKIEDDQQTVVILDRTTSTPYPVEGFQEVDGVVGLLIDIEE